MNNPPNGIPAIRTRAYEFFANGESVASVADILGIYTVDAFRLRTDYLIELGEPVDVDEARQRLQQLKEHLGEAHDLVAQLESHLKLALQANQILRERESGPPDLRSL